jgi:hypothetical protein
MSQNATPSNQVLDPSFEGSYTDKSHEEEHDAEESQDKDMKREKDNQHAVGEDYFINHIENLNKIKKEKKQSKIKEINELDNLRGTVPDAPAQQPPQIRKRNLKTLRNFYEKMIVYHGFKKCKCQACFKMVFPILIKYDVDSSLFTQEHLEF